MVHYPTSFTSIFDGVHRADRFFIQVRSPAVSEEALSPGGKAVPAVVGKIVPELEGTTSVGTYTCANSMK